MASLAQYRQDAEQLGEAMANEAPVDRLDAQLAELGARAQQMIPEYVEVEPACTDYLAAAAEILSAWRETPLEVIERDYHADGALPTTADTGRCYSFKDLIVHPATARALLAQTPPDRDAAMAEIEEVIAHAERVIP